LGILKALGETTMRLPGLFVVAIAGATMFGCAHPRLVTSYTSQNHAPVPLTAKTASQVELLTVPPSRAYVEIGTVTSKSPFRALADDIRGISCGEMVSALRQEAARQGCDGLVVDRSTLANAEQGGCVVGNGGGSSGACLVYVNH